MTGKASLAYWNSLNLEKKMIGVSAYVMLFFLVSGFFFPVLWLCWKSLFSSDAMVAFSWKYFTLQGWKGLFTNSELQVGQWLFNTIVTSAVVIGANLVLGSTLAFYSVFFFKTWGKMIAYVIVFLALMPLEISVIPHYNVIEYLHLEGTLTGLVLPHLMIPFTFFLFYKYFQGIDPEIIDFARCDGCNDAQILWYILVPVTRPVFIVLALILIINWWNMFLWPLIVLVDSSTYTINLAITQLSSLIPISPEVMYACAVLSMIPVLAIFIIVQKIFIRGLTLNQLRSFY